MLQPAPQTGERASALAVSDLIDFSIYVDAHPTDVRRWYVERFLPCGRRRSATPRRTSGATPRWTRPRPGPGRRPCGTRSTGRTCARTSPPPARARTSCSPRAATTRAADPAAEAVTRVAQTAETAVTDGDTSPVGPRDGTMRYVQFRHRHSRRHPSGPGSAGRVVRRRPPVAPAAGRRTAQPAHPRRLGRGPAAAADVGARHAGGRRRRCGSRSWRDGRRSPRRR